MNNLFHLLSSSGWGSIFFLILPILLLIVVFLHFKKKKESELKGGNRWGRRGKKDHIWQILKEYHRKTNLIGSTIEESFLFERPHPSDLRDRLVSGLTYLAKQDAKARKLKFKRPKYPSRLPEEDYFDRLEQETHDLHSGHSVTSHKVEDLRHASPPKRTKRKRYVIFYKTRQKGRVSPWLAIEVELIKQPTRTGRPKDIVVVNGELDVDMEFKWIAPMLAAKIEEKTKRKIEAIKRDAREKGIKTYGGGLRGRIRYFMSPKKTSP